MKTLFCNAMTFLHVQHLYIEVLGSYRQISFYMISFCVVLLQHNLKIYSTIQIYKIILSLT